MEPAMEDVSQHTDPITANLESISRPGSASSQTSLSQLPGISALAESSAPQPTDAPPLRPTDVPEPEPEPEPVQEQQAQPAEPAPAPAPTAPAPPPPAYSASPPATTTSGSGGHLPTCQNCSTSTTPLWRRDEHGSVLCNACGLFLKLHGRPRPISLKTDVIKSRNRVKTVRPDMAMKKKNTAAAALNARRTSQKGMNANGDGSHSPITRTTTPNMYNTQALTGYPAIDDQFQPHGLSGFGDGSGRAGSPLNGESPQTHEQLIATNASLKTRVSELEVINDFIRGRLEQLERYGASQDGQDPAAAAAAAAQNDAQLRAQIEAATQSESQLRSQLEESHRRENMLKRRLDEMELELKDSKEALEAHESGRAKRLRVSDMVKEDDSETATTPQSTA